MSAAAALPTRIEALTAPGRRAVMKASDELAAKIRWFDNAGTCRCGKPGHGILRGIQNQSFGAACNRCAEAILRRADQLANEQRNMAHDQQ